MHVNPTWQVFGMHQRILRNYPLRLGMTRQARRG